MRKFGWTFLVAAIFTTSSAAHAAIVTIRMYNDSVGPNDGFSHVNATNFSDIDSGSTPSGLLKDIDTGATTGITATHTAINVEGGPGVTPTAGDAFSVFDGFVDLTYSASYGAAANDPWSYSVTFTGLDPNSTYEFVTTANRNSASYDEDQGAASRWAQFGIVGATGFTGASSSSDGVVDLGGEFIDSIRIRLCAETSYSGLTSLSAPAPRVSLFTLKARAVMVRSLTPQGVMVSKDSA